MKHGRLRAYEVLLRIAQVRDIRASSALAEASEEERKHLGHCAEMVAARDAVTIAGRLDTADVSRLDIARYEMLSNLDVVLAEQQHVASHELAAAEQAAQRCAMASVLAKRYREQIDNKVEETGEALVRKLLTSQQEEAMELWLARAAL